MRLRSSSQCRRCGYWLEGAWGRATSDESRAEIQSQMDAGECFACQRKRLVAAMHYMRLADEVRLLTQVAAARGEPVGAWMASSRSGSMIDAERSLTAAGMRDFRPEWVGARRRETWH